MTYRYKYKSIETTNIKQILEKIHQDNTQNKGKYYISIKKKNNIIHFFPTFVVEEVK